MTILAVAAATILVCYIVRYVALHLAARRAEAIMRKEYGQDWG